ncbi:hypothetical protein D5086_030651 [Populus alba]|uniref:Uncharacterized protein n=1 Tax=Populus alba TaxID=43335 RepID=A0ACC4AP32_POPAL
MFPLLYSSSSSSSRHSSKKQVPQYNFYDQRSNHLGQRHPFEIWRDSCEILKVMENNCAYSEEDEQMELPPGFRFHPTDEELITHYLSQKVLDNYFCARAIGEVDLNKCEPWDLPYPFAWLLLQNDWVICRVFEKSHGGKKTHISGLVRLSSYGNELKPSILPPLMDSSQHNNDKRTNIGDKSHVTCFSNPTEDQKPHETIADCFNISLGAPLSSSNMSPSSVLFSKPSPPNSLYSSQILPNIANFQYPDSVMMPEHSMLRILLENHGPGMNLNSKRELSEDTGLSTDMSSVVTNHELVHRSFEDPSSSAGPVDLDYLWNY